MLETKKGLSEDPKKRERYFASIRNFVKVLQSLTIYDKNLPHVKEFLYKIRSVELIQSLQGLLCAFAMRCKQEFQDDPKE